MAEMAYPGSLASLFNRHHTVGKDLAIDPDTQLRSYQDDINHGNEAPQAVMSESFDEDSDEQDEDSDDE